MPAPGGTIQPYIEPGDTQRFWMIANVASGGTPQKTFPRGGGGPAKAGSDEERRKLPKRTRSNTAYKLPTRQTCLPPMGEVSSACAGAVRFVTALPCSVSFLLQKRTANGRPYGVERTKAFSLRRRWPANGGTDEVSAP